MPGKTIVDQMGNRVTFSFPPKRIVSLVPSQSELLAFLGLDLEVVGITKFCVHPEDWRKSKAIIGGTKNFRIDTIQALRPDLIIGNKEENYPEGITRLSKQFPVWMSDINTFQDALGMILSLGEITDRVEVANKLVTDIKESINRNTPFQNTSVLYLIWKNPWMGAASGTYIHEMLGLAGLTNALHNEIRYPNLSPEEIKQLNPELVFLSSEPFPFAKKHITEIKEFLPEAKVILVDREMFSWYGSRMLYFTDYIESLRTRLS